MKMRIEESMVRVVAETGGRETREIDGAKVDR
jgi:hypothetical protein